jgi:hypothetical protein
MTIHSNELRFSNARKAIAAVAIFGFLALAAQGQEPGKVGDKAAAAPPSPGLLIEWAGVVRVGNPYDVGVPSKEFGERLVPVVFSPRGEKTPADAKKLVGGSVYFAVFKNQGAEATKNGDTFGTGMKGFDQKFFGGNGYQFSPAFDTTATYLYLYQVVNGRGRDPRNFIKDPPEVVNAIDVGKVFKEVSPPSEPIARWALSLAVRPRDISSWGYFNGASFVAEPKELLNIFGRKIGKNADSMIEPISYLPSMQEPSIHPAYKNRAAAYSLGLFQETFRVGDSEKNIGKDPGYIKDEIKLVVEGKEVTRVLNHDVKPSAVELIHSSSETLAYAEFGDQDYIRSALLVKFDDGTLGEAGLAKGRYSTVFGFTSNLPPQPERVRIDTAASVRESRQFESRAADLFSRRALDAAENYSTIVLSGQGTPPLLAFSREPAVRFVADTAGSLRTAGDIVAAGGNIRFVAAAADGREIPGPVPSASGAAAISGGFSTGLGGSSHGGGMGGSFPSLGVGGAAGLSGFGGGAGGIGGNNGGNPQQQQQQQQIPNSQTINFNASLINQQQQQQQQLQFQIQSQHQGQHQGNHNHPPHPPGPVVPAPASLLLGLLGLPVLVFLRRRKPDETPETTEAVA